MLFVLVPNRYFNVGNGKMVFGIKAWFEWRGQGFLANGGVYFTLSDSQCINGSCRGHGSRRFQ